jgi:sigma-B regulation protein RsbU (phosphoserine phosphatase)
MSQSNTAKLIVLDTGEAIEYLLTRDVTKLGRLLQGREQVSDITIDSNMVSQKHARIVRRGSQFFIEDLGSTNKTFVNGSEVKAPVELKHDDRIKLGPKLLRFVLPSPPPQGRLADPATGAPRDLNVEIKEDLESSGLVTGTVDSGSSRFGILQAKPQEKLKAIIAISQALAGTIELESILPRILESLFRIFPSVDRGVILLKHPTTGQMIPRATRHRKAQEDESVVLSRAIVTMVLEKRQGILSADALGPYNPSESLANFKIRSMMCVPLLGLSGEPIGLIHIDTRNIEEKFNQDDLDLLAAIAGQAALNYETARLFESHLAKQKYDTEMGMAADVQRALLPSVLPRLDGYEFFASYESAQAVGGDYYDCRVQEGSRVWVAFGDVAGKGVAASLIMSRLSSVVQSTFEFVPDVGEALARINTHMNANMIEGRFVTLVLASLDLTTHEVAIASGGHMSPLVRRVDGTVEEFPETVIGFPVGIVDDVGCEVVRRTLNPGETIVIYTDGVSEAHDPQEKLYGTDRLRELVSRSSAEPAQLGKAILDDVRKHAAGSPQNDDITLMVFGRSPSPAN